MANDVLGIGLDYTFARVTGYSNQVDYINDDGQPRYIKGTFKESITKQRFLLRMSVHFATTNNLDPYVSFGAGYKQTVYKNNFPNDFPINNINLNLIPISFRAGVGMRYFFSEHIGMNIEAGFGGPAIQAGLTAKF
jgi:opacity protein-like surface antigen